MPVTHSLMLYPSQINHCLVPTEFTSVPFPVKALKLLLHDIHAGGEAASKGLGKLDGSELDSDDEVRCIKGGISGTDVCKI